MTAPDPRPEDSFARRFALEQAVAFAGTENARFSKEVKPSAIVVSIANTFLAFLKGEAQ